MLFVGLFLIAASVVSGIILISFLRLTETERPSFLSSTATLIFLSSISLFLFFVGLILLLAPVFS